MIWGSSASVECEKEVGWGGREENVSEVGGETDTDDPSDPSNAISHRLPLNNKCNEFIHMLSVLLDNYTSLDERGSFEPDVTLLLAFFCRIGSQHCSLFARSDRSCQNQLCRCSLVLCRSRKECCTCHRAPFEILCQAAFKAYWFAEVRFSFPLVCFCDSVA